MLSQLEKTVLKKIAETNLVSKPELRRFLETNGNSSKDLSVLVDTITRRLAEQKLITSLSPVGSTCYVITQKGNQFLKELEI